MKADGKEFIKYVAMLKRSAVAVASAACVGWAMITGAFAQVSTIVIDVDATFTLQCISPLEFDVTANQISAALTGGVASGSGVSISAGTQTTTTSGSGLSVALPPINQPLTGNIRAFALTVTACSVSASPGGGRVQVTIANLGNNVLRGPNGSRIRLRPVRGRVAGTTNNFQREFRYNRSLHNGGGVVQIELQVRANLRNAWSAGLHSSNSDGSFTIEVTTP
jgi:hypothetical protein